VKTIIIKRSGREGADSKMFRAYNNPRHGVVKPTGISCSTTGNESYAIVRCAAKAFIKLANGVGDLDEFETRIKTRNIGSGQWVATLES
jgi:hypothetical protein